MWSVRSWFRRLILCGLALVALVGYGSACAEKDQIVLSFAGDCTLGAMPSHQHYSRGFIQVIGALGFDYPFSGVREVFAGDDWTLVNLEGTFTDIKNGMDKPFIFRATPAFAQILPLGSVEAVNIANNHINDYGAQGRLDTIAALEAQGIVYSGDGILSMREVGGVMIGMTGYSYPHRSTLASLKEDIAELRAMGCDVIIFSMHSGTEEEYRVTTTQKVIARGAIDLGVDIVVGHHAHVVQTVEVYQGKPIFYGLGNFAFGGNINPKDWDSMIGQIVLEKDESGVRLAEMRILPCRISDAEGYSDFRPVLASGEQRQRILDKLRRYTSDDIAIDPSIFDTGVLRLDSGVY